MATLTAPHRRAGQGLIENESALREEITGERSGAEAAKEPHNESGGGGAPAVAGAVLLS